MRLKTILALAAVYIIWGSTYLGIRFTVETIPPFLSAGIRFLISGLLLFFWRRAAGDPMPTFNQWRSTAIVGLFLLLGGNGLVSWSELRIASSIAAIIIGTVPMWMVLIESIRPGGVRPNWQSTFGLLTGFAGIYLLVGPENLSGTQLIFDLYGVLALLVAAFLWSLGSIYSRSADLPASSLMTTGTEMLAGSLGLFLVSWLTGEWHNFHLSQVSMRSLMGVTYLIIFGSLIGFVSYAWLLRHVPVSLVATYAYVNPVVAVVLGSWIGQELLTPRIFIAVTIIISSVVLINSSRGKQHFRKNNELSK